MEPETSAEVEATDPQKDPPTPGSISSEVDRWMEEEAMDADGDVDWLDPGTPPPGALGPGQTLASAPDRASGDKARGAAPGGLDADSTAADSLPERAARDLDEALPGPLASDGRDRWLWVDPRQEPGYDLGALDLAAFLSRASDLFRSKEWTGGRKPARLAAHPIEVENGLKAMAESLGLELVSDPRVTAGTYRLGLASDE
jgi:hypothetical protein